MSVTNDLMVALGCASRRELAERMGTSPQRVSAWDRDGMPAWAVLAARDLLEIVGAAPPKSLEAEHQRIVAQRGDLRAGAA